MIEELVSRVFATRNITHLFHWNTRSFAQHQALGEFYEALPGLIDVVVEDYQGAFDRIGMIPLANTRPLNLLEHLTEEAGWINTNMEALSRENEGVENRIQDLLGAYLHVLYKLRNLS